MSMFWKVAVGLLLTLPMGAYITGTLVASQSELPTERAPIVVTDTSAGDASPSGDVTAKPTEKPAERPTKRGETDDDDNGRRSGDDGGDDDVRIVRPTPDDLDDDDSRDDDDSDDGGYDD